MFRAIDFYVFYKIENSISVLRTFEVVPHPSTNAFSSQPFGPKLLQNWDWELLSTSLCREFRRASFPTVPISLMCNKKCTLIGLGETTVHTYHFPNVSKCVQIGLKCIGEAVGAADNPFQIVKCNCSIHVFTGFVYPFLRLCAIGLLLAPVWIAIGYFYSIPYSLSEGTEARTERRQSSSSSRLLTRMSAA